MTYPPITSIWAWELVQESLSEARASVYGALAKYGPKTALEVASILPNSTASESWHKRLPELERQKVIERTRIRPCSISGRMAYEWRIIHGAVPLEFKGGISWKARAKDLEEALKTALSHSGCSCLNCSAAKDILDEGSP